MTDVVTGTIVPADYRDLARAIEAQLAVFPAHRGFLARRFRDEDAAGLAFAEDIARMVLRIAGPDLAQVAGDYRWFTDMVLEEELHFRRHGRYRLSKFQDALEQVYANKPYMTRYMNGLLASQLWWRNHTEVLRAFRDRFIARNPAGFTHLEVGPGHGLFLALAASSPNCARATGWDISEASLSNTRAALDRIDAPPGIALEEVNLFASPKGRFQSLCFSEVLEHLEDPKAALDILFTLLAPGGRIFVNAPVNSPAPDHLYLFRTPEDVADMVRDAGFAIEETVFAPPTGATLEKARKGALSISAAVIAARPS